MNLIMKMKNQLCYPCNFSIYFIKVQQVLNQKGHNLGKKPLGSHFCRLSCKGFTVPAGYTTDF